MLLREILLKNFKSFKTNTIKFSPGVTAIVGPNGSGKSNIVDAIRFVFGEKRLKHLRVKKASELVHMDESSAYVSALLEDNNEYYEIKRIVKKDGKVKYKIGEKSVSLSSLKEFLRRKGIKAIDTFVIAQGEITKITLMNPKERRVFIDEISGIAEFEEKKKEAMRELESVDSRIKEANIIIGEKIKYLEQLKKEKEEAEIYEKKKRRLDNIRATLISKNIMLIEKKIASIDEKKKTLIDKKDLLNKKLNQLESEIKSIYRDRENLDREIEAKTKRSEIYKKMENLKTKKAVLEEKLRNHEQRINYVTEEISSKENEIKGVEEGLSSLKKETEELRKFISGINIKSMDKIGRKSIKIRTEFESLRERLLEIDKALLKGKEKLNSLEDSLKENRAILELLDEGEINIEEFENELNSIEKKSIKLFEKEKSLNNKIAEYDRRIIKIKEKLAILRASVGNLKVNPVDVFLHDLVKNGKIEGFYGKAIDLIDFEDKFAEAVEAAAGGRLLFYVVDDIDSAKKAIDYIKKMKLGRASFIPLKELKIKSSPEHEEALLKNFIKLEINIPGSEKLLDFLFGPTVVVDSFAKAKKLAGKKRVVTLDGELFEPTAVISGGKGKGTLTAKKAIESLERELDSVLSQRKSMLSELSSLRDEISTTRSRKTYLQNKIKELEATKSEVEEKKKRKKEILSHIENLEKEKIRLKELLDELSIKKEKLSIALNKKEQELKEEEKREEELFGKEISEREKKIKDRIAAEEKLKSISVRIEELKERKKLLLNDISSLMKEKESLSNLHRNLEDEYRIVSSEIVHLEEEFEKKEEEIKGLMIKSREIEEKLRELSGKDKLIRDGISNAEKILNKLEVERASLSTKYEDLKQEILKYPDFVEVEGSIEKLNEEMTALEKELSSMSEINFAAKELYYRLYDEVGEVKEKLDRLKLEKDKIIEFMAEIDERKKESFFSHLEKINNNFHKLFDNISNFGKGSLYLEDPSKPFETGLNMKLIRNDREIPLESLSGGEQTIMSLLFIFALQSTKPSPFYVLDEIDAALDKLNSQRMSELIKNFSKNSQIIVISHNDVVISSADSVIGVTRSKGYSKAVHLKSDVFIKS